MGGAYQLRPHDTVLEGHHLLQYFRREFPGAAPDLMMYHNGLNDTLVLARWVSRSAGLVAEVDIIDELTQEQVHDIRWSLNPNRHKTFKEYAEHYTTEYRAWLRQREDDIYQQQDRREHERRQLNAVWQDHPTILTEFAHDGS